ncbi:ABC transporter permease [Ruminococcus sp.]|uniref:ABC transporter permease n=1 Tax=Ruminococcus sp. TaxID=41978 RepID=UPI0025D2788E|nr:ABC transporter permease [Ruminococcus sp.]
MLKNNNQGAVKRIAARSMKQNRMRNLFAVLAIILTTFMFTTVFSIGFSLGKNLNTMMLREQGTKAAVFLDSPTETQIAQAKQCDHLNAAGLQIEAGSAQKPENSGTKIALRYYDKTEWEENFLPAVSDVTGNYPTNKMEIMLSKAALDALEISQPKSQMDITVTVDGEQQTFQLSGWFTDYCYTAGGFQGFVSKAYTDSLGLTVEENGTLSMSAKVGAQRVLLEELDRQVTLEKGQEIDSTYDVQDENGSNVLVAVVCMALVGLIIVFSGYLLIYNVMYISVTKDIRFYGMLKTIGTSPKQIRKMVRIQAFRLSAVGIPAGILLGTLVSFVAVPYAMKLFGINGVMPTDISFNPFIYMGTILFGIFTVAVSCRKPAKLASRVSPVEALKYNGQNTEKIKPKKSTDGGKLHKMAYRNVFREKKRAVLVFASLFMGTMAFLSTNTFIGSMKLENYVDYYLPNDYTIYTNCDGDKLSNDELPEEKVQENVDAVLKMAEEIAAIDGVKNVSVNRSLDADIVFDQELFRPFLENQGADEAQIQYMIDYYQENAYSAPVISVSTEMMELYNQKAKQKIDIERFEKGEICFVGYVNSQEQAEQVKGKTITLTDPDSGKSVSLDVGSCPTMDDDHGINVGYYWEMAGAPSCVLISDAAMEQLTDSPSVDNVIIDCDPKAESYVTARIKELTKVNPAVQAVEIKSESIEDFQSSMTAMNILTAGISIVLILIGVINFINVMLTGVFTRRKELAVLESVGMTKKQVRKMLMFEGVYYGLITIVLILTVGNVIVYAVAKMAQRITDYAVFHYPWILMLAIAAVILLICIVVPALVYRTISKDSVTERLRNGE